MRNKAKNALTRLLHCLEYQLIVANARQARKKLPGGHKLVKDKQLGIEGFMKPLAPREGSAAPS